MYTHTHTHLLIEPSMPSMTCHLISAEGREQNLMGKEGKGKV